MYLKCFIAYDILIVGDETFSIYAIKYMHLEEKKMSKFDKVIGYNEIKKDLIRVCDMINNRETYEKMGAKLPNERPW